MEYLPAINGYSAPPLDAKADKKLGWLKEQAETAETFLKSQRVWPDIDRSVEILCGTMNDKIPLKQSKLWINMIKRDTREIVATMANMRPLWGFKTDNDEYQHQRVVLNQMLFAWYTTPSTYGTIRKGLQYATSTGLGYLSPLWARDGIISGRGDIALKAYGARDVLPFGIGRDNNLQGAYVVTIRVETPIHQAMALYPTQLEKMIPDRGAPTWMRRGARRVQRFLSPVLNMFGPGSDRDNDESIFPTVDIFHSYIMDLSINETGRPIMMGAPGTKWHYTVPPYGSDIPTSQYENNQPLTRKATYDDAKLFPLRRLMLWTKQGILYDDTSMWWHGKAPVVPIRLDDCPSEYIGFPSPRDVASIQDAATSLGRGIIDSSNAQLDPAIGYDENQMSRGLMERFKPRSPGQRIGLNMQMSEAMKPLLTAEYYRLGDNVPNVVENLYEKIHYLLGTRDIQALAKAKQIPSGDSIEKLLELSGPILTDMSRGMEGAMVELGEMWKGLAFEFYDMKRRVQILGKDGVSEEDFDYNPGDMIPSHLPDELELIRQKEVLASRGGQKYDHPPSRASVVERARAHQNSFYFHITPNSMHQITQLTKKMLTMNLWKIGFPIDPWSVAEAMDLENYGTPAALGKIMGTENVPSDKFGRWLLWRELLAKLAPQQGQPGRKGSGQVPPTVQHKDGGTRQTTRESPR